jgi:hypothetical protein
MSARASSRPAPTDALPSRRRKTLYFATARIAKGMTSDITYNYGRECHPATRAGVTSGPATCQRTGLTPGPRSGQRSTPEPRAPRAPPPPHSPTAGSDDVSLPENKCGGVIAVQLDDAWSGTSAWVSGARPGRGRRQGALVSPRQLLNPSPPHVSLALPASSSRPFLPPFARPRSCSWRATGRPTPMPRTSATPKKSPSRVRRRLPWALSAPPWREASCSPEPRGAPAHPPSTPPPRPPPPHPTPPSPSPPPPPPPPAPTPTPTPDNLIYLAGNLIIMEDSFSHENNAMCERGQRVSPTQGPWALRGGGRRAQLGRAGG